MKVKAVMAPKSLKCRIRSSITRSKWVVFVPADFSDLSSASQVGRALRELRAEGVLIRFGRGLYAKAKRSPLTNRVIPVRPLPLLAVEALTRKLNVEVVEGDDLRRYNAGRSTQVPTGRVITVRGGKSRRMSFGGVSITFRYVP
ncbi:MAG: DUF6088 family protein [Gammaproteobacteria bacterium]